MNSALIFAGGTGTRMNSKGKPKQFLELHNKPIIIYTIEKFENCDSIDEIIVVCHKDWINYLWDLLVRFNIKKVVEVVPGGKMGQHSIRNGLRAISKRHCSDTDIVLIHDGVRPLIYEETIETNISTVKKLGNCITTAPVTETVVRVDEDEKIEQIYDRSLCRLARAPQSFFLKDVLEAHIRLEEAGDVVMIDTAMLMNAYGVKLNMIQGPCENIKITTPMDFYIFKAIIDAQENSQIWGL